MIAPGRHLVALASGGTGGHVFPAEALAAELGGRGYRLALITDRRGNAFGGSLGGLDIHRVSAGAVAGKSLAARLRSGPELALGTLQARRLLKRLRPDVVVGFGGYASVPTMLAARFGGYSTLIHEQNAVLGRANRLLASRVGHIATSFETCHGLPPQATGRVVRTGMPVRPAITAVRERPYPHLSDDGPLNLLVLGGSQGAHVFSEVVPAAMELLPAEWRPRLVMVQQCRAEDMEATRAAYRAQGVEAELAPFFDDVPERLAAAHLVICRAGASTVAEVATVGRPAVMVPYPHAVDDHQTANAHAVAEAGAGWLLPQEAFTPEVLAGRLEALFELPASLRKTAARALAAGRPDAAARLADLVSELMPNGERSQARRAA